MSSNRNIGEEVLDMIVERFFNQKNKVTLKSSGVDPRFDSAQSEGQIISDIENYLIGTNILEEYNLKFITPNSEKKTNREWYDFAIASKDEEDKFFLPVNVKISNLSYNHADNLNCKLGIGYALTGKMPEDICMTNGMSWPKFADRLELNLQDNDCDYYFLIIDKSNAKNCFWTSLKYMQVIVPNGSNLPFQADWNKNRKKVIRSFKDSAKFLIECLNKSMELARQRTESCQKSCEKMLACLS